MGELEVLGRMEEGDIQKKPTRRFAVCPWEAGRKCLGKFADLIGIWGENIGYQDRVRFFSPSPPTNFYFN